MLSIIKKALIFLGVSLLITTLMSGCGNLPRKNKNIDSKLSNSFANKKIDVLFLAYDHGESSAFKAIIPCLKNKNLTIEVLSFGAAETSLESLPEHVKLSTLLSHSERTKYSGIIKPIKNSRNIVFPEDLVKIIKRNFAPKVLVVGMASAAQAQLSNEYALDGVYTAALYDNFDPPKSQQYVQPWLKTTIGVNEIFLPGEYLISDFLKLETLSQSELTVTGQPAIDSWLQAIQKVNKKAIMKKLNLADDEPIVVFAAGYDKESLFWLNEFLNAISSRTDIHTLIALHPKMQQNLDAELTKKIENLDNVHILPASISTEEASSVANVLVTHKSTTGFKVALAGVPVIYMADKNYSNILINHQIATRVSSWSGLMNALHRLVDLKKMPQSSDNLHLPTEASARLCYRIQSILSHTSEEKKPLLLPKQ